MLKKLIQVTAVLGLLGYTILRADTFKTVQMSTTGAVQAGTSGYAMNIGSGTIASLRATTSTTTTGTFTNLTTTNFTTTNSTATNQTVTTLTATTVNLSGELKPNLTSSTSGQYMVSRGSGTYPFFTFAGRIMQAPACTEVVTSSCTTSTSFITSTLSRSITPVTNTSTIFLFAEGNIYHSLPGFSGVATLANGTTDLASGSNGMCEVATSSGTGVVPCMMIASNSPGSVSAQTYNVRIKTVSGLGQTCWNGGNTVRSILCLFEIGN